MLSAAADEVQSQCWGRLGGAGGCEGPALTLVGERQDSLDESNEAD